MSIEQMYITFLINNLRIQKTLPGHIVSNNPIFEGHKISFDYRVPR